MIVVDSRNTKVEVSARFWTTVRFAKAAERWRDLVILYSRGRRTVHNDHRRPRGRHTGIFRDVLCNGPNGYVSGRKR